MRKLILQNMVTLDGYFEGPNHELDWHNVDAEFNGLAIAFLGTIDTLVFGRRTYELMASYWPTPAARTDDPTVAAKMNSLHKVVFSKTLKSAAWNNTELVAEDPVGVLAGMKKRAGGDMALLGSSQLSLSLAASGLIDVYRLMMNPVFLGDGKPLLAGLAHALKLRLVGSEHFTSGNVLLTYVPTS